MLPFKLMQLLQFLCFVFERQNCFSRDDFFLDLFLISNLIFFLFYGWCARHAHLAILRQWILSWALQPYRHCTYHRRCRLAVTLAKTLWPGKLIRLSPRHHKVSVLSPNHLCSRIVYVCGVRSIPDLHQRIFDQNPQKLIQLLLLQLRTLFVLKWVVVHDRTLLRSDLSFY